MHPWQFDVSITTHELLQLGVTEAQRIRVEVSAPAERDATLLAVQMGFVAGYVTDCAYVE
jgi:hypothetical protein